MQRSITHHNSGITISSKGYSNWRMLKKAPIQYHYTIMFWIPLYIAWLSFELNSATVLGDSSMILLSLVLTSQLLAYLISYHWSIRVNSFMAFGKCRNINEATHIYLESYLSPPAIIPISYHVDLDNRPFISFVHLEARFLCFDGVNFIKTKWPSCFVNQNYDYLEAFSKGNHSDKILSYLKEIFGLNSLNIPIPSFISLFKEHAIAPFFIFQLVCIGLWMLDTYWYHSLMTLVMLVIFESTVVFQRLKNMKEIRGMATSPQSCFVKRNNKWISGISSEELLPGDIIGYLKDSIVPSVPADMLILQGSCIVNEALLSGESTPCMKEAAELHSSDLDEIKRTRSISFKSKFKNSALFSGTKVLQITSQSVLDDSPSKNETLENIFLVCLVVKTGFSTTQGKLVRTMCLGRERMSANNAEAGYFLLFLLCFAVIAAVYVWNTALMENPDRSRWKLLVQCLLIITSVVPPELPMELSMAVNASLVALSKLAIFCTEPFRLPVAGSIDVCCFDKTGTLTQSHLEVIGISGISQSSEQSKKKSDHSPFFLLKEMSTPGVVPGSAQLVISTCHSLVMLNNTPAGDPLEVAALNSIPWSLSPNKNCDKVIENSTGNSSVLLLIKRFPFSPSLKRMSVMVEVEQASKTISSAPIDGRVRARYVTCKGAPEAIYPLLSDPPEWYSNVAEKYASEGCRVIALAFKSFSQKMKDVDRFSAESHLTFAGFLIFATSLKKESFEVIKKLSESSHKNVMITGDHVLTAIHVAKKLGLGAPLSSSFIVDGDLEYHHHRIEIDYLLIDIGTEVIAKNSPTNKLSHTEYVNNDQSQKKELKTGLNSDNENLNVSVLDLKTKSLISFTNLNLFKEHLKLKEFSNRNIAITGPAFEKLSCCDLEYLRMDLLKKISVCARFSPSNKEDVLRFFKMLGWATLMCGDGTNDVGALKQAHIGVALLDGTVEDLEKIALNQRKQALKRRYDDLRKIGFSEEQISRLQANEKTSNVDFEDSDEIPTLQFGDASVAAPFTSKIGTLESVCHILRQGRATLAATFQMYKILALNSLITAYSLSVLHNAGVRWGDFQLTVSGLLLSSCFFFLSRSKPLPILSKERPAVTIFTSYSIISIIGQFLTHCIALVSLDKLVRAYILENPISINSEDYTFTPSLMNSSIYLVSLLMQVSTFAINYQGPPFRESIFDNNGLIKSLCVVGGFALISAAEIFPDLNEFMQLVPFPSGFSYYLLLLMVGDFLCSFAVELVSKKLFSKVRPKWNT